MKFLNVTISSAQRVCVIGSEIPDAALVANELMEDKKRYCDKEIFFKLDFEPITELLDFR